MTLQASWGGSSGAPPLHESSAVSSEQGAALLAQLQTAALSLTPTSGAGLVFDVHAAVARLRLDVPEQAHSLAAFFTTAWVRNTEE